MSISESIGIASTAAKGKITDSMETRLSIANITAFVRGVSSNEKYSARTFSDAVDEALEAIKVRLDTIAALRSAVPDALKSADELSFGGVGSDDLAFPDLTKLESAISDAQALLDTSAFGDLGGIVSSAADIVPSEELSDYVDEGLVTMSTEELESWADYGNEELVDRTAGFIDNPQSGQEELETEALGAASGLLEDM